MEIKSKFQFYKNGSFKGLLFVILLLILSSTIQTLTKEGFNSAGLTLTFKYVLIYIFLGISLIPGVYIFNWGLIKLENNNLGSLPVELQSGILFGLGFFLVVLYIGILAIVFGPLISPNLFQKSILENVIEMIIVSIFGSFIAFLIGVIVGFIIRIKNLFNK
jgi:hypothetical protein